jgi:hypothetical protein
MKASTFQALCLAGLYRLFADRSLETPADWCCRHLQFDEPKNRGPFNLVGREYLREPLDWWADPSSPDGVKVFGSQSGKSAGMMGGAAWTVANRPTQLFWVMPTKETAGKISRVRWQPLLKASEGTRHLVPAGTRRHEFKTFQQILGSAVVDMTWSNSAAALASVPCDVVILDEVDKFNEGGKGEADAVDLAEQRTKDSSAPKRMKSSTPTTVDGMIWQEFLKSDQRRRFVPCPHCGKFVVLIWSKPFTVFKLTGNEAPVVWDKEAKRPDGTWDADRVMRSARYQCPHCGGHIQDRHKARADRGGRYEPTNPYPTGGYRGWHLPSLYAPSPECGVGRLALKFLQKKQSLLGLQGFINGDLAEPYMAQDTLSERVELITSKVEVTAEWRKILTVDCQAKAPYFWHVVRAWNGGNSEGLAAGPLDSWDDIRAVQLGQKVPDVGVVVDSGFGARADADVYRACARFCEFVERNQGSPVALGWMPAKGMPTRKRWRHVTRDTAGRVTGATFEPWYVGNVDPFLGTGDAGRCEMSLFEFAGDFFKDILDNLRRGRGGYTWKVAAEMATDEYWRHMDSNVKTAVVGRTGKVTHQWLTRSKHWPDHLLDCEVEQVAVAVFFGLFKVNEPEGANAQG